MELIELITPSGHKVYLKPYLNTLERREVAKVYGDYIIVDPETKQQTANSIVRSTLASEECALKALVQRVVDATGKEYKGIEAYNVIMAWETPADGDAVFAKINTLTTSNQLPPEESDAKKK
jgi:hypothetical protein